MAIYKKRESIGNFLEKGVDFKENDMVEIASEGKPVEGKFGTQDIFFIKTKDGKEGNVSFNQTTINSLIDGYGEDSLNWIGKEAKVWAILSNVQGKMKKVYYFLHPDAQLDEGTGQFFIPGKDEGEIPIVEEDETPINEE